MLFIKKYINNDVSFEGLNSFSAILGESPSNGARSPILWNKVYSSEKIKSRMLPLDVSKENMIPLLEELNKLPSFLGGAIAVPYKELVAQWCENNISERAKEIGAVNCLYKKNGKLFGTNTDGEASLMTFKERFGNLTSLKILILGIGGAGKAVASYFSDYDLTVCSRSLEGQQFAKKIKSKWIPWDELNKNIFDSNVIINCTSLGYGKDIERTPVAPETIASLKKDTLIFDIIYQPLETKLLKLSKRAGLKILNGLDMNLQQAVLAFKYSNKNLLSNAKIEEIMSRE